MDNTIENLSTKDLVSLYERLLRKLNEYTPDMQDYIIVEDKIRMVEKLIEDRRPGYFKLKEDEAIHDNILSNHLSVTAFSAMLNVSKQTIYKWIKQKKLNAITIANRQYIPKTETERILANGI